LGSKIQKIVGGQIDLGLKRELFPDDLSIARKKSEKCQA
jgi:hypothetical protein